MQNGDYDFHEKLFLHFNKRRVQKDWQSPGEQAYIIAKEIYHQTKAAWLIPSNQLPITLIKY